MRAQESSSKVVEVDFDPFAGPALAATAPSTEGQREIWAAAQMGDDASLAYNESVSLTFEGALDAAAFRAAVTDLVERHEALRTTLSSDGLTLCIAPPTEQRVQLLDLTQTDEREQKSAVRSLLAREVQTPFQLEQGPLFRVQLVQLGASRHLATFTAHHIVCDGWSLAVMLRDLGQLYTARVSGRSAMLAAAPAFSHYARAEREYERSAEHAQAERYWLERLSGTLPTLELPLDAPRPPSKTYASLREDHVLDAALVERLKRVGGKHGASFFTTLFASFCSLLGRISGENDLVVGIPAAGQSVTGETELVGHCVNTLPVRVQLDPNAQVPALLRNVRTAMLDAFEHQRVTYGGLLQKLAIARDPSRLPLVSVLFNLDQAIDGSTLKFAELDVTYSANPRSFENFEIFVNAAEAKGVVTLECQFNTDLFSVDTIRRWLAAYEQLLRGVAEADERAVGRLDIVPAGEREKLLYTWNATFAEYPRELTVHALFEDQARRTPDAIALVCGEQSITFGELDRRANQLAHRLRRMGVGADKLVGLCMMRSIEMVIALSAILKAGGAYVPLDPAFPRERLAFMVEDAKLSVLVTERPLVNELGLSGAELLCVDEEQASLANEPREAVASDVRPEHRAYVIYTSGSTGKPKGVCVPHRAVVNFITSMAKQPGLAADDVLLAVTTLSFDIAVLELHLPLSVGARVILASREMAMDGVLLRDAIERHGVTTMQATPSTWRLLLSAGFTGGERFKILCGGEALPRDLAGELTRRAGSVWNMYGPTETTVWSTCFRIPPDGGRIAIGAPIANTTVYVLDEYMAPVPVGVPGELHIGGDGVTLGYLDRPELTRERFVADPFASEPSARLYKTGDVVRFLPDGNLEYLRRNDNQIKFRGYRIELGEIEAQLAKAPGIAQAAVLLRELHRGDTRLIGYVVCARGESPSDADLRAHLRGSLPEYMLPQHFVRLSAFPLTPNQKVDRKALPAPTLEGQQSEREYVAPRDAKETAVVAVLEDVLGMRPLSVTANFFDLGGHSILAAQVLSRLRRDHGYVIPLRKLFEAPTAEGLARAAGGGEEAAGQLAVEHIPKLADGTPAPLSLMQQRLWILEQIDPGLAVYNLPSAFRIRGALDIGALERALAEIGRRHEAVRTSFAQVGSDAVQVVAPSFTPSLMPPIDLSQLAAGQRETRLIELLKQRASRAFTLTEGPLVEGALYRLADDEHVFFWMAHHAVWDGWSFDVFLHELDVLYGAFAKGQPSPLPELPIRYRDFSAWHRGWIEGPELRRQEAYWRKQLGGTLPVLELPTDRPRPAQLSYRGGTEAFFIPKAEIDALTALGRRADATLYMVMLSAFTVLLHRYTGQQDILIGTPIRGRTHPDTENLLGFFVNTLVFRTDLSGQPSFVDLLARVRKVALDAYAHQDMPFEKLVQELSVPRDLSRTPVFQAFFTYQDVSNRASNFGGLSYSQVHVHAPVAPTDLYLWVKETGAGLTGGIDYASDLFERETMVRFVKQFRELLAAACVEPTRSIARMNILPDAERRALLAVNETQAEYPREASIASLVERQALAHPQRVAVEYEGTKLTYGELNARATALALSLRERGVRRDALVGIYLERSPEMLVALLAVLKAGGGYVPLDPAFPTERLAFMVEDSALRVIVSQRSLEAQMPHHRAEVVLIDEVAAPTGELPSLGGEGGDATAYVIYTSGSTGKPKGVIVPQRAVVNFLSSTAKSPGLSEADALLAVTTLSFDIAVLELWLPLSVGARIVLASREEAADGDRLLALLRSAKASVMQATPATWRMLIAAGLRDGELATALVGGEALPLELGRELASRARAVWNMYGPTETTVWSTSYALHAPLERVLIGRPLDNTRVYVVDGAGELCPYGVPGELLIGGDGVTRGYLHRPELTAERFHADPFVAGGSVYRTGDIVRLLPDGNLEYQRRTDNQVKVRGYRIELGEIESALERHPAIGQAVVLVREDRPGDVRLVAYPIKTEEATDSELRAHLRKTLPEYMIPQHFVELSSLPMTPNGKVDRKALPPPGGPLSREDEYVAPETPEELRLAQIWCEALGVERVSVHDNFFTIGGHSLLALQVIGSIEQTFGMRPSPRVLLLNSLQQVAAQLPSRASERTVANTQTERSVGPAPSSRAPESPLFGRLFDKVKKKLGV